MKKLNYNRSKVFDGFENQLFESNFSIDIENKVISFIVDDLTLNKLSNLYFHKQIIDELSLIDSNSTTTTTTTTTKDRLGVYYLKSEDLLIIFSMGEYQPGRYMLFIEGVYEL